MARWWIAFLFGTALLVAASPADDIVAVIQKSADDWNRGDLKAYVQCYEQSRETTFVSSEVVHGTDGVLARYQRNYPDKAHMGELTFSQMQVRPLSSDIAIATGRFTLERTADGGGHATGLFTLVLRRGPQGWRIIHDHTHATP